MADQRTEEWHQARAGKLTASCFVDIISTTKGGKPTAARGTLMRKLAFERMAGTPAHEIGGRALTWGTEVEEAAVEGGNLDAPVAEGGGPAADGIERVERRFVACELGEEETGAFHGLHG